MKFGSRPVEKCENAILAHTLRTPSRVLRKGTVLSTDDLKTIADAGHSHITVAVLEDGDVGEDRAAHDTAQAISGEHVEPSPARTGRCNLIARTSGVLQVDATLINRLNAISESVTVATLPPFATVREGDVAATVKIIPYAVPGTVMEKVTQVTQPALRIMPFLPVKCGLVVTHTPGGREALADKAAEALATRLGRLGMNIAHEIRCPHEEDRVADAIRALATQNCEPIFVFGGAAASDRGDVVPAAIEASGGHILHFGMPVEPGNLLVLGEREGVSVIGMPSCARSIKTNGFDWVMTRVLAGITVAPEDIMGMGVGGLLTGHDSGARRRKPKRPQDHANRFVASVPRVGAIILAAGRSTRMGDIDKLIEPVDGKPMLRHVAEAALASQAAPVIVVTGTDNDAVGDALEGLDVTFVPAEKAAAGMSESLKAGISALPEEMDGAVICLGDMPYVTASHIDRLISHFDPAGDAAICVATHQGKRGNPVLWSREYFPDIMALEGDTGARRLIARYESQVAGIEMDDPGVLRDFDTPNDFS